MDKKLSRIRRSRKTRAKIRELNKPRLTIFRTPRHIYAQVIAANGSEVVAAASTTEKALRDSIEGSTGNVAAAASVGKTIAERAKSAGVETVAFDRAGFKYHGRVKALADAARKSGLEF
ncbi:50S ribosomal protein L18 [Solemya velum gill symbiont]|uniref:50S ribosomal protein L18 n=1 Tax=Solemya velum gill symbiont TaxID=2340 RepID=UPI0009980358|nr:50S ribosomal protein L18 [Solemya velum gill symbiont]OOZ15721.1 50S ribosomal protein L18 [Solemya velum gill symbiont]OOZ20914.1 50S ribosomal protein L18 [Solemya velum gill symbiont]OOZ23753.1 50S ribosomal protein L18 [Solemya velum gill symbiont]OOZ25299.1 50S ribosomal protein L18 [Solemya velum gill symbiont]OOZ30550.1 50S ribosomal protein L18 [Solemya velum gill symbiont]